MAVITVSRQFGSGGEEIATRVCELLNYHYYEKRLMAEVVSDMGLSDTELVDFSEDDYKMRGFLDRLLAWRGPRIVAKARSWKDMPGGGMVREVIELNEEDSIMFVRSTIEAVYKRGNAVIVGRGGQAILKDKPDALHVRVIAPYDTRVQRLYERGTYNLGGAKDEAIKRDRASAEYLKRFYDIDWDDPGHYDLVLNTSKLDLETAAQMVAQATRALPSPAA